MGYILTDDNNLLQLYTAQWIGDYASTTKHRVSTITVKRNHQMLRRESQNIALESHHKNYLDHVYAVSDDNGNILEHYRYNAFGEVEIYNTNGNELTESAIDNKVTWNSRRYDSDTKLHYYKYRHYNPALGRWLSRDPIEEDGGINLYAFIGNDVFNDTDMLGLCSQAYIDDLEQRKNYARSRGDKKTEAWLWKRIVKCKKKLKKNKQPSNLNLQFNLGKSIQVGGCFNAGPVIVCVTGGFSVSKGKCCDDTTGKEREVVEVSGSVSASTGIGIATGFTYSYNPIGTLTTVSSCPKEEISDIWDAIGGSFDVNAQAGPFTGGCSWSGPSSGWSCSGGFEFAFGASITVGGTISVSGQYLDGNSQPVN